MTEESTAIKIKRPAFDLQALAAGQGFLKAPDEKTWIKEIAFALQILRANKASFEKCVPDSIRDAVLNIALTGATLNPAMQQAFLIPRTLKGRGLCCCLDFSYRGLVGIATREGAVLDIDATCVYEGDEFDYHMGLNPDLTHKPCGERDPKKLTHVYAVAILQRGLKKFLVMNRSDIEKARKSSQAPNSPMWTQWYEEGARKTVVKRFFKLLPHTERMSEAVAIVNAHEGLPPDGKSQEKAREVDARFGISPVDGPLKDVRAVNDLASTIDDNVSPSDTGSEDMITDKQVIKLNTCFSKLAIKDDARLAWLKANIKVMVNSTKDLTKAKASEAIDKLEVMLGEQTK